MPAFTWLGAALLLTLGGATAATPASRPGAALLGSWEFDAAASLFDGGIPYQRGSLRFEAVASGAGVK